MTPASSAVTSNQIILGFAWPFVALAVVLLATGAIGFHFIDGSKHSWIDCFYTTFVMISTIGFNEIMDLSHSPGERIFTIAIAFAGIGTATHVVSTIAAYLVEEIVVPAGFPQPERARLNLKDREYILLAVRDIDRWHFNPDDRHVRRPGNTLVVMATRSGKRPPEEMVGWV